MSLPTAGAVAAVCIAPKEDGVLALGGEHLYAWDLALGHPEFNLRAILRAIQYESTARPEHVWQSTSGTDDFEPKFGLWPLVFGTLKATLYCLLFGVPIALLAALYTSEFVHPSARARIKPTIELMASLPSVVLGFLAALVFAPFVEQWLTTILAAVLTVPLVLLVGAQVWQAAPTTRRSVLERLRLPAVMLAIALALLLATVLGPGLDHWLFAGDLKAWLAETGLPADQRSSAFGGWFLVALPGTGLGAALLGARLRGGCWRRAPLVAAAAVAPALLLAGLCTLAGFDLRGSVVGIYDQRNSLVVGFVMGFAVIPIIYTIAEDALTAVPEHLRAASLGAGATPWQTAVRIILPTAMSGIFSAVMVGLGRAVGETMIVLMAAGNTPVLELNVFNGFRTLSANIATELPEAVRDSTHYRVLYLAAFTLFLLTFALNTVAEVVRMRFRRRAFQL
jgi:phosphate transport system permease protein